MDMLLESWVFSLVDTKDVCVGALKTTYRDWDYKRRMVSYFLVIKPADMTQCLCE